MTGYVKISKADLKVKELEIYRGIYCSLCNALGRNYSVFARLLLSYDFAFATMLKLALSTSSCTFNQKRCPLNPAHKCYFCESREEINFCSHAIIIIAYYKIIDNLKDKEIGKKLLCFLLKPIISLWHKKAVKNAPEVESIVKECMLKQAEIEARGAGIDEAADQSAIALGKIFSYDAEENKEQLYKLGYYTGRFVYILDAVDDLPKDLKNGNFNPFAKNYNSLKTKEEKAEFALYAEGVLNMTQSALLNAKDMLKLERFGNITENVLFKGLDQSAAKVLEKYKPEEKNEKSFTVK